MRDAERYSHRNQPNTTPSKNATQSHQQRMDSPQQLGFDPPSVSMMLARVGLMLIIEAVLMRAGDAPLPTSHQTTSFFCFYKNPTGERDGSNSRALFTHFKQTTQIKKASLICIYKGQYLIEA